MTKRAVLIGCNYSATPSVQLKGCINDIVNVRNMLIDAYGYTPTNIIMLRDDNANTAATMPTRANILAALNTVVSSSAASDEIWIHYSGHGTQVVDTSANPDEPQDEAIVPCDYQKAGFILDDELFDIIKSSIATTLITFDSCHSGTAVDLQYSVNYNGGALSASTNGTKFIQNPNIFMMSGCRDNQTSADAFSNLEKMPIGAFTDAFLETLRLNEHDASITRVYTDVCVSLSKSGFSQVPSLSCSSADSEYTFKRYNNANANATTTTTTTTTVQPITTPTLTTPIQQTAYTVTTKPKPPFVGSVFYKVSNNKYSSITKMPLAMSKK